MVTPYFSVIIPTYNSERTIEECLQSLVEQTYKEFEILVIDGLSADDTLKICESFNDKRIKTISEKDSGIYDAMNKGINSASGEWLYFLGSDDKLYDKNVLADTAKETSVSKYSVLYGNVKISGNAGWAYNGQVYDGEFNLKKLLKKNIAHQCVFYAKECIQNKQYNLNYKVCADYDLNISLYSKYTFKYFDRIIANFKGGGYSVVSIDDDFSVSEAAIKYFFSSLWKKEFSSIAKGIRFYAGKEPHIVKKLYLYLVYLKHLLLKN